MWYTLMGAKFKGFRCKRNILDNKESTIMYLFIYSVKMQGYSSTVYTVHVQCVYEFFFSAQHIYYMAMDLLCKLSPYMYMYNTVDPL